MKVRFENLCKSFNHGTLVVNNFSATLTNGHLICLLGPSGCGKSTILNMLCGIIPVTSGHIYFDDEDVTKLPPDQRDIGMVFQNYALYPHMTVLENIAFPLEVKKVPKKERLEKAAEIAKLVHIEDRLDRYPSQLSGGQQQRVAIARALIKNPKLLLMDEPLSNLDARLRLEMREEIRRIQQETGVTTVFVTHDQEEAMAISDSILLMKDGELVQSGLCQELYNQPINKFVSDFLGNPAINQLPVNNADLDKALKEAGIPFNSNGYKDQDFILAIRPESFTASGNLEAQILSVSEMGKERIITLKFFEQKVHAILNSDIELNIGSYINLGLKSRGIFVFEKSSGERLV